MICCNCDKLIFNFMILKVFFLECHPVVTGSGKWPELEPPDGWPETKPPASWCNK